MSDVEEIKDVLSRFFWAADEKDEAALRGCLTTDFRFAAAGQDDEYIDDFIVNHVTEFPRRAAQHHHTNITVKVEDDLAAAKAFVYAQLVPDRPDPTPLVESGSLVNYTLRRTDDGWRIEFADATEVWSRNRDLLDQSPTREGAR